ncbi:MAG TPA: polymer-forming cytoskeletal protein [Burkholderiales bacterium]
MRIFSSLLIATLLSVPAARADDERPSALVVRTMGSDTFVAGEAPRVAQAVKGDLVATGGDLRIAAPVAGDIIAAGGAVSLEAPAGQDLYAAGCRMSLAGDIARNARVAGCSVSLGPQARIGGNASFAAGRVEVLGSVGGYLQAASGNVLIDGAVAGDVDVAAGALELGPRARIGGKLRYRGSEPLRQDPAAQVQGGIERLEMPPRRDKERGRAAGRVALGVWTLGLMLLAAVLVVAFPGISARVTGEARTRFGWSLLAGFLALVAIPAAAVVLFATVIGIPLALLALIDYFALLLVGYVAAGAALGDAVLKRWVAGRAAQRGWRALFAALGVLAIGLVALVPWLGALVAFLALIAGMGAMVLMLKPRAGAA